MNKYKVETDKKTVYFEKYKFAIMGARFLVKNRHPKRVKVTNITSGKVIFNYEAKE